MQTLIEGQGLSSEIGEEPSLMFQRICEHCQEWKDEDFSNIRFQRLQGMSNACYRVFSIKQDSLAPLLYRKFESKLANKQVEAIIFKRSSDAGIGPKLVFQNEEYRIEEFFNGRPLTLWELRNPFIFTLATRLIFEYNYSENAFQNLTAIMPKSKLQHDMYLYEWAPEIKNLLPAYRRSLASDSVPHPNLILALDRIEQHLLFEGFQDYFEGFLNRSEVILAHNDTQENNFLIHREDNRSLTLIDYEYTGWCCRGTDLANFINESAIDNVHPSGIGVKIYLENMFSEQEQKSILTEYLRLTFGRFGDVGNRTWDQYLLEELPKFVLEVRKMCLMTSFQWAIWALKMMPESEVCNENVFNIWYAQMRVDFFLTQKQQWGL